ncbi:hypothetical protein NKG05_28270 [Oerskovia sp. M15]
MPTGVDGHDRDPQVTQGVLVALEHALERLGVGASKYPATLVRICCFVIDTLVFTRAITRFNSLVAGLTGWLV